MTQSETNSKVSTGRRSLAQNWALASLMTVVTILCARLSFHIPMTPIPVTLQVYAVLLAGLVCGRGWGAIAEIQYLILGAAGLHVFAGGGAGPADLFGFTGGYLLSYPIAAAVCGWIAGAASHASPRRMAFACAVGLAIIYGLGCVWFAAFKHESLLGVVLPGALIFLGWDSVKAAVAIASAKAGTQLARR